MLDSNKFLVVTSNMACPSEWNATTIEKGILAAEYANKMFMRSFGESRITTFIGMRLSLKERAMLGARYAALPGNIDRNGTSQKLWRSGIHSLCWEFGIRDRGLPLRA